MSKWELRFWFIGVLLWVVAGIVRVEHTATENTKTTLALLYYYTKPPSIAARRPT